MEGIPSTPLNSGSINIASPLYDEAVKKASDGDFDGAEGLLWNIASIFHGGVPGVATEDDPIYVRQSAERIIYTGPAYGTPCTNPMVLGKSLISPRDPGVHWYVASCVAGVDRAKAKWEEGAPARAAEWEKGAPLRKAAEEVARLKAEIARVEQEEVDRQAALAKEALEKLRIQKEEEEEKARKAEVTSLERDAVALREKLAAMKELMALKAVDPLSYAAISAIPSPAPTFATSPFRAQCEAISAISALSPLRAKHEAISAISALSPFRAQDFMSNAQYRKLRETNGFPLNSDQHVCHIIAESNGGANHIDNYYVAAGSLNQSLGNRNDFYLAEAAGLEQTKKAIAVSRTTGYTGPCAEDIIDMAKTLRAKPTF